MKPCLHPSIVSDLSLQDYLELANRTGYASVDVDFGTLQNAISEHGFHKVQDMFDLNQLQLASFGLPVNVHGSDSDYQASLRQLPAIAELALRLGATRCCTWLWSTIDEEPVPYASRLARRFRESANVLSQYGIGLGLEFVGPHHLRHKRYPFVLNLQDLLAYMDAIHAPNVGILLDSYHWYTAQIPLSELRELKGHQIIHVHLNDSNLEPELAHDQERLLPGEGRIDLQGFISVLDQIGYVGPVSLEVLHKTPFLGTDEERAKRMYETVLHLIKFAREKA